MPGLLTRSRRLSLLILGVSAGLAGAPAVWAQMPPPPPPHQAMISVTGEGRAAIAPDMAVVSLTVTRTGETADAALAANNAAMRDVLAALKADGIAEREIQTSDFSIFPQYSQQESSGQNGAGQTNEAPRIIGYQVSNGLSVRVRDLAKLGGLIDHSVKLGVNQGGQISFTNDDPKGAMEEARRNAVADAMTKAKTLADAAGTKLGPVVSITENGTRPVSAPMMRMAMAKEADSVPVSGGENSYTVTVDMRFEIAR
ncbi:uncharacterized protein YggE [Neorhizobium galegae]|uniref:SIMPL domain-containing protein n=1 Tax=Neorhizobium galegae TaxID=399 RepID=UPI001AE547D5|nr:SIMPL domain-containing protein [Neorhizobium galegae]MBP2548937.1 uncharacterized protein YggE [Neorhizobium galegae]